MDFFTIPPSFTAIVLGRNWIGMFRAGIGPRRPESDHWSSLSFLGMRFFRIARILNIPDILQFLHILRSSNSIRLTRMLCLLFTVWLSAAGFVHLVMLFFTLTLPCFNIQLLSLWQVENSGDFFQNYSNSQPITYFQCVYFLIVTMR